MNQLTEFVKTELNPRIFNCAREIFPSMEFEPYKGGWASKFKLDGTLSHDKRMDKSVITKKVPHLIFEQGGGYKTLVDFYKDARGISFIDAVKELCGKAGIEIPSNGDAEKFREYCELQGKLEAINIRLKRALTESSPVYEYLTKGRAYKKCSSFIKRAEFGFVDKQAGMELRALFPSSVSFPFGVGTDYTLSIPYRSGGYIQGFVFRTVKSEAAPKYKDAFISEKASKRYHLFGLTGLPLTGNKERDRYITIVEGEIDALRACFAGVENVVGASGGNISTEALKEAKSRGVKGVTLLFDTEATPEGRGDTCKKITKAIHEIEGQGLHAYVCSLPSAPGVKTDVDSFLNDHEGEELRRLIEGAEYGYKFLFNRLFEEYEGRIGEEGRPEADKLLSELTDKTIGICNAPNIRPEQRDLIFASLSEKTGGRVAKETIAQRADALRLAQDKDRQADKALSLFAEAVRKTKDGKTEEAFAIVRKELPEVERISEEGEFSELFTLPTAEGIKAKFKERPLGVETSYSFENREGGKEPFVLPTGALTYICAPTSHGKSRMLENLALQLTQNQGEGAVLYFTFEEDESAVTLQMLNIYLDMTLSKNNIKTLRSHYAGKGDYFGAFVNKSEFERKEAEFFSLIESGKLRVFYRDFDSSKLIRAIRHYAKNKPVKAVFIDYIQLLHKAGCTLTRKDELKGICKDLMALAVDTSLPIILASQLNREAASPLEMAVQNIAEASDIEHSANIVLLLWNSVVKPTPQKSSAYFVRKGGADVPTEEAKKLESRGFKIGEAGKLYVTLAKNRGGARNIDAVLDFDGNRGVIKMGDEGAPDGGMEGIRI